MPAWQFAKNEKNAYYCVGWLIIGEQKNLNSMAWNSRQPQLWMWHCRDLDFEDYVMSPTHTSLGGRFHHPANSQGHRWLYITSGHFLPGEHADTVRYFLSATNNHPRVHKKVNYFVHTFRRWSPNESRTENRRTGPAVARVRFGQEACGDLISWTRQGKVVKRLWPLVCVGHSVLHITT